MQRRIDEFLLRVLRPKVVTAGAVVVMVLLLGGLLYAAATEQEQLQREEPVALKFLLIIPIALATAIAVAVTSRAKGRRFERDGLSGIADILDLAVVCADDRFPHGTQNVAVLLRITGVGMGGDPQVYRIFRTSRAEAETFATGQRRPVRVLPDDLSVVLLDRASGPGKPLQCRLSHIPIGEEPVAPQLPSPTPEF